MNFLLLVGLAVGLTAALPLNEDVGDKISSEETSTEKMLTETIQDDDEEVIEEGKHLHIIGDFIKGILGLRGQEGQHG